MDYINIDKNNIDNEHLCCAISDKKHQDGVCQKKEWLSKRIEEGHVFRKLCANGKIFIEYAPLETAWTPVSGDNYMYIYCLWVAGSFKNKGHGKELLNYAIEDAKNQKKSGICVISSKKKKPFLSEKGFFEKFGFKVVDNIGEYELLSLSFNGKEPHFNDNAKCMKIESKDFTIYYSSQCPYTNNSVMELKEYSKNKGIKINFIKVDSLDASKNVPCIFNSWANFVDGEYYSNCILNSNMLEKILEKKKV